MVWAERLIQNRTVGLLEMAKRENGSQTYVMVVETDVNIAITRADWLASHGYQAVLVQSIEGVIEKLSYFRPQLVFVGRDHSEPSAQIEISQIVQLIRTVCPGVPMITIDDRAHETTNAMVGQTAISHSSHMVGSATQVLAEPSVGKTVRQSMACK